MTRLFLSVLAAAMLVAAPAALMPADAATKPMMKPHKPMKMAAAKPRPKTSEAAAVDALNDQSLARAKGGQ